MTENEAILEATHRHYKGGLYKYHGVAKHSETLEEVIIYEHLWPHERQFWVRPVDIWHSPVDGTEDQVRFVPIDPEEKQAIMVAIVNNISKSHE